MPEVGDTVIPPPRKRLRYVLDLPPAIGAKVREKPQYVGECTGVTVLRAGTIMLRDADRGKCDFFAAGEWLHCETEVIGDA